MHSIKIFVSPKDRDMPSQITRYVMTHRTVSLFKIRMHLWMLLVFGLVMACLPANAQQQATNTTLALSTALANVSQPVTLTATVSSANTVAPTVTFMNGTTTMGTAMLNGSTAIFTASNLAAGTYSIYATYAGDSNNAASASYVDR